MFQEAQVGDFYRHLNYNQLCLVTSKTSSSIELFVSKVTDKGISTTHWFTDKEFEKIFEEA